MKKLRNYLMIMVLGVVLFSSSCSKNTGINGEPIVPNPTVPTSTSGKLHPEFVGLWMCDSTWYNGSRAPLNYNTNFEFDDVKVKISGLSDIGTMVTVTYDTWSVDTGKTAITVSATFGIYKYTIIQLPSNNKMVLEHLYASRKYRYFLHK